MWIIPMVVGLVAVGAAWALSTLHFPVHRRDVILAALLCTVSAVAALLPAHRRQGAGVLAVFQFGLIGSVLHLGLTVLLGAVIALAHLAVDRRTFLFVLIACYWASLVVMVRGLVRIIRDESASAAQAGAGVKAG